MLRLWICYIIDSKMYPLEYFLNAVYYSMNKLYIKQAKFLGRIVDVFILLVIRNCIPTNKRENLLARIQNPDNKKIIDDVLYGEKSDFLLGCCDYYFAYFSGCYDMFLAWIIYSLIERYVSISFGFIASLMLIIGYIFCYFTIYRKNKYIIYFKKFKKNNACWHRKWKWITITFVLVGISLSILGFLYYAHNHIPRI